MRDLAVLKIACALLASLLPSLAQAEQLAVLPLKVEQVEGQDPSPLTRLASDIRLELLRALEQAPIARVTARSAPGPAEPLGSAFVPGPTLAALGREYQASWILTGSLERDPEGTPSLTVAVWRVSPAERLTSATASVAFDGALKAALQIRQALEGALAAGADPVAAKPLAPEHDKILIARAEEKKVAAPALTATAPLPPVETINRPARILLITGIAIGVVGAGLGVGSYFLFNAPLNDGSVRSGADNADLLQNSKTGALIADLAAGTGLALAAAGVVALITGLGESPVEVELE